MTQAKPGALQGAHSECPLCGGSCARGQVYRWGSVVGAGLRQSLSLLEEKGENPLVHLGPPGINIITFYVTSLNLSVGLNIA